MKNCRINFGVLAALLSIVGLVEAKLYKIRTPEYLKTRIADHELVVLLAHEAQDKAALKLFTSVAQAGLSVEQDALTFLTVDMSRNSLREDVEKRGVLQFPTVILFKDGNRIYGADNSDVAFAIKPGTTASELRQFIRKYMQDRIGQIEDDMEKKRRIEKKDDLRSNVSLGVGIYPYGYGLYGSYGWGRPYYYNRPWHGYGRIGGSFHGGWGRRWR